MVAILGVTSHLGDLKHHSRNGCCCQCATVESQVKRGGGSRERAVVGDQPISCKQTTGEHRSQTYTEHQGNRLNAKPSSLQLWNSTAVSKILKQQVFSLQSPALVLSLKMTARRPNYHIHTYKKKSPISVLLGDIPQHVAAVHTKHHRVVGMLHGAAATGASKNMQVAQHNTLLQCAHLQPRCFFVWCQIGAINDNYKIIICNDPIVGGHVPLLGGQVQVFLFCCTRNIYLYVWSERDVLLASARQRRLAIINK